MDLQALIDEGCRDNRHISLSTVQFLYGQPLPFSMPLQYLVETTPLETDSAQEQSRAALLQLIRQPKTTISQLFSVNAP